MNKNRSTVENILKILSVKRLPKLYEASSRSKAPGTPVLSLLPKSASLEEAKARSHRAATAALPSESRGVAARPPHGGTAAPLAACRPVKGRDPAVTVGLEVGAARRGRREDAEVGPALRGLDDTAMTF